MKLMDKDELKHARFHMDKYYTKVVPYSIESEESKASAYMLGWNDALDAVMESAPTIDAVPVVRCKDCKYSVDYYQDGSCYCRRPSKPMEWIEKGFNWFCADGKRQTE